MKNKSFIQTIKNNEISHTITFATMILIGLTGLIALTRYLLLGQTLAIITVLIINIWLLLFMYIIWKSDLPWLLAVVAFAFAVLFFITNYFVMILFNVEYLIQAVIATIGFLSSSYFAFKHKIVPQRTSIVAIILIGLITLSIGLIWGVNHIYVSNKTTVEHEIWTVPDRYDAYESPQQGSIEEITYQTYAYATDNRAVEKTAFVYLPYNYDEEEQYNILYLMHGTGDDETTWLLMFEENKIMIDNLIYHQMIEPMIIVTPTFYVEDDYLDDLDELTYTFKDELRHDLIPYVENQYATYADSTNEADLIASRHHRAFAGLSRGAVTMFHAALGGSLDYFASFGAFSGSRTSAEFFQDTIQSDNFNDYSIDYLYVSSGNFDFALPGQIKDYQNLLNIENRLQTGLNTRFDVFPMKYHAMSNWHLALYNYLQVAFKD